MSRPSDYGWIVKWGRLLGSYDYYIRDEQRRASEDNAPLDATFKRQDGSWARAATITNETTRFQLGLDPLTEDEYRTIKNAKEVTA